MLGTCPHHHTSLNCNEAERIAPTYSTRHSTRGAQPAAADSVPVMYRIEDSEKFRRLLTTWHHSWLHLSQL